MYQKGQYVVYRHDVCIIKDIKESKTNSATYYVLNPIDDNSLIINVPIKNKMGFLRDIISSDDAKKLIAKIPKIKPIEIINEKNIEIVYKELLDTGNHEDLIKIIKTTYLRNENRVHNKKKASEKDNIFFTMAEKYLYNELSISLNMSVDSIKKYISKVVNE